MNKKTYYLKNNPCYKAGKNIGTQKGIIVHSTGAVNNKLSRYIQPDDGSLGDNPYDNDWNQSGVSVCVHAMIGKVSNGDVWVYEILPYTYACWGCGKGSAGSYNYSPVGHIQFEILEGESTDKDYFNTAWNTAVEYCVWLCKKFNFDQDDIVSHKEACSLGYASNHGDADSYFKIFGKTMDDFRAAVKKKLNTSTTSSTTSTTSTSTTSSVKKSSCIRFMKVNTTSKVLNCRKQAKVTSTALGQFKKGQELLFIEKHSSGWIKVKGLATNGKIITGYCSPDYLKLSSSSTKVKLVNTTRANLYCREKARVGAKSIGQFAKGSEVAALEALDTGWTKVKGLNTEGKVITGYCSSKYLK